MTKVKSIFISLLLLLTSTLLYFSMKDSPIELNDELVSFVAAFAFVIGLFNFVREFFRLKKN
ncbi:hypothetical protein L3073_15125 [Ancylomarina sp. DW003]|nr:hypothetical protein [Ancylomarina sp. DW003]MDE5423550.1 hypothetical protein [Ancylomarina sp. DW003]